MRYRLSILIVALTVFCLSARGQQTGSTLSYEEVVGKDKVELEDGFLSTVRDGAGKAFPFDCSGYVKAGGRYFVRTGRDYCKPSVRNDSYAVERNGRLQPLSSVSYPEESVMTLLTQPAAAGGYDVEVIHHKYGFREDKFCVNLSDLLASCIEAGCEPFVGIESSDRISVSATLFLVNESQGYNHVLQFIIPVSCLRTSGGQITADLHTYIPTHNISKLFAE